MGEEFDFETTEEVKTSRSTGEAKDVWTDGIRSARWRLARCKGSGRKNGPKLKPSEQGVGRAEKGKVGGRAMKGRVNLKIKARTRTWSDVVKGLKEDELETSNSDKSGNESETTNSVEKSDSDELNHMKTKRTRRLL